MGYKDKDQQKAYQREWYLKNKGVLGPKLKKQKKARTNAAKDFVNSYKEQHPCLDCGFSDYRALEFDHVTGIKNATVSDLVKDGHKVSRIEEEIAECEVVCSNCHKIRHYDRRAEM